MRNVINKGLTEEVILKGAMDAFRGGWNRVKLYFMLGLPGEQEDDIAGIGEADQIRLPEILYVAEGSEKRQSKHCNEYVDLCTKAFYTVPMGTDEYKGAGEGKAFLFVGQDQKSA